MSLVENILAFIHMKANDTKAFDKVQYKKLFEILGNLYRKDIQIIHNLYGDKQVVCG